MKKIICTVLSMIMLLSVNTVFAVSHNGANIYINPVTIKVDSNAGTITYTTAVKSNNSKKQVTHVDFVIDTSPVIKTVPSRKTVRADVYKTGKTTVTKTINIGTLSSGKHKVFARAYWIDGNYNTTGTYSFTIPDTSIPPISTKKTTGSSPLINKITRSTTSTYVKFNSKVSAENGLNKVEIYYGTSKYNLKLAKTMEYSGTKSKKTIYLKMKKTAVGTGTRWVKVVAYDQNGYTNETIRSFSCRY